jgi:hypothetical protein
VLEGFVQASPPSLPPIRTRRFTKRKQNKGHVRIRHFLRVHFFRLPVKKRKERRVQFLSLAQPPILLKSNQEKEDAKRPKCVLINVFFLLAFILLALGSKRRRRRRRQPRKKKLMVPLGPKFSSSPVPRPPSPLASPLSLPPFFRSCLLFVLLFFKF